MIDSKDTQALPTVSVWITCEKKPKEPPFFWVSDGDFRHGRPEVDFKIEWAVKQGCKAVVVGAYPVSGGDLRDFARSTGNGKKATAIGVLDPGATELVYHLCVERAGRGELAFGEGERRTPVSECVQAVADPQPPPKVIGPGGRLVDDDEGGQEDGP